MYYIEHNTLSYFQRESRKNIHEYIPKYALGINVMVINYLPVINNDHYSIVKKYLKQLKK